MLRRPWHWAQRAHSWLARRRIASGPRPGCYSASQGSTTGPDVRERRETARSCCPSVISTSREDGFIASRHSFSTRRWNLSADGSAAGSARTAPRSGTPSRTSPPARSANAARPAAPPRRCPGRADPIRPAIRRRGCDPSLRCARRAARSAPRCRVGDAPRVLVVIPIDVHSSRGTPRMIEPGSPSATNALMSAPTGARSRSPTRPWLPRKWSLRTHQSSRESTAQPRVAA